MTDLSDAPTAPRADRRDNKNIAAAPNFDLLAGVSLRVSVEVGSTSMTLAELLAIDEGSVIELDRAATDLLDIYANGTLIAKGEIVSVDGRYGIQVAEVVAPARGLEGFERRACCSNISFVCSSCCRSSAAWHGAACGCGNAFRWACRSSAAPLKRAPSRWSTFCRSVRARSSRSSNLPGNGY